MQCVTIRENAKVLFMGSEVVPGGGRARSLCPGYRLALRRNGQCGSRVQIGIEATRTDSGRVEEERGNAIAGFPDRERNISAVTGDTPANDRQALENTSGG